MKKTEKLRERLDTEYDDLANGKKTVNQVRADHGLEPIEGGDVLLIRKDLCHMTQFQD